MKNLTLLSVSEAKELPKKLLKSNGEYWLRPDSGDTDVYAVNGDGAILKKSKSDLYNESGVRLVGDCNKELAIGSRFMFNNNEFEVYSPGKAVSREIVDRCVYSTDGETDYQESNAKLYADSIDVEMSWSLWMSIGYVSLPIIALLCAALEFNNIISVVSIITVGMLLMLLTAVARRKLRRVV